jgi:hypothetical protein
MEVVVDPGLGHSTPVSSAWLVYGRLRLTTEEMERIEDQTVEWGAWCLSVSHSEQQSQFSARIGQRQAILRWA